MIITGYAKWCKKVLLHERRSNQLRFGKTPTLPAQKLHPLDPKLRGLVREWADQSASVASEESAETFLECASDLDKLIRR